jgi:hypothetical protein
MIESLKKPNARPHYSSYHYNMSAPVLQIMLELQELCGESSVVLPMELGLCEPLAVATSPSPRPSEPCEPPAFVDNGGVLAPNSEVLYGKEVCDLLVSLEAVNPGYGKDIACVLTGKASDDLIRKVEKSLWKRKVRCITRKA